MLQPDELVLQLKEQALLDERPLLLVSPQVLLLPF
jgi:hypothetical protein